MSSDSHAPILESLPFKSRPLGDEWLTIPNADGLQLTVGDGFLNYRVQGLQKENQWTWVQVAKGYQFDVGLLVAFQLRANQIEGEEVKFTIGPYLTGKEGRVILRFTENGQQANYVYSDNGFQPLGKSAIRADGQWHRVVYLMGPPSNNKGLIDSQNPPFFKLWEDEEEVFTWGPGHNDHGYLSGNYLADWVQPCFSMQVLSIGASASMDLSDVLIVQNTRDIYPWLEGTY